MGIQNLVIFTIFVLFVGDVSAKYTCLTWSQVYSTKKLLARLMVEATGIDHGKVFHPHIAGSVRLGFHDCVGGCDGCINLNNPDNAGLDTTFNALNELYAREKIDQIMSRADFFALAGIVGAEVGARMKKDMGKKRRRHTLSLNIPFRWGRIDCPTSPLTTEMRVFPMAMGNLSANVDYFKRVFDLDAEQFVAVLGAHTLGDAGADASGFDGEWVIERDVFDNDYYRVLSDKSQLWVQENENPSDPNNPKWQWNAKKKDEGKHGIMMLNADMELFRSTTPNDEGRTTTCPADVSKCPFSRLAHRVKLYATDNARFLCDFSVAFGKMLTAGYKSGDLRYPSFW